jgi:hypothetical protein
MIQKDFDAWNTNKKIIHTKHTNKLYHKQEIWWCSLGVNVGFEQDAPVRLENDRCLSYAGLVNRFV